MVIQGGSSSSGINSRGAARSEVEAVTCNESTLANSIFS